MCVYIYASLNNFKVSMGRLNFSHRLFIIFQKRDIYTHLIHFLDYQDICLFKDNIYT